MKTSPPEILPALGLVERVLLPGSRCRVVLTTVSSYGAVREATRSAGAPLLAAFSASPTPDGSDPLSAVGVLATVADLGDVGGRWVAALRGVGRVHKQTLLRAHPFRLALVERWSDEQRHAPPTLVAAVQTAAARYARARRCISGVVRDHLRTAAPWELPGIVMPLLDEVPWTAWQALLEADSTEEQLAFVLAHLCGGAAGA
jgi:Lon protease-like protein